MLHRPALREYRTWIMDSRRWRDYRPRPGDIVIATYPKSGTTWMQRIVSLLIFASPEPRPIWDISAWIERRFPEPIEAILARIEAQTHRRFLKSHLPIDGLPLYDEVSYIHVARDGLDVAMSYHNHTRSLSDMGLEWLSGAGMADETIAAPYPSIPADPAEFFGLWLSRGAVPGQEEGWPTNSWFEMEQGYWRERRRPNLLLVHYNDLKADLAGEMRRVAEFLRIEPPEQHWPQLVQAASFEAMRRDGAQLLSVGAGMFQGGSDRFFFKGTNERWRVALGEEELALYQRKLEDKLDPACARWLAGGRLKAGDPRDGATS